MRRALGERAHTWACSTAFTANLRRRSKGVQRNCSQVHASQGGGTDMSTHCFSIYSHPRTQRSAINEHTQSHTAQRTSIRFCALLGSNWEAILSCQIGGRIQRREAGALRGQGGPRRVGVVVTTGKLATCSFRRDVLARARKIDT
jgi:hypothetical protein